MRQITMGLAFCKNRAIADRIQILSNSLDDALNLLLKISATFYNEENYSQMTFNTLSLQWNAANYLKPPSARCGHICVVIDKLQVTYANPICRICFIKGILSFI